MLPGIIEHPVASITVSACILAFLSATSLSVPMSVIAPLLKRWFLISKVCWFGIPRPVVKQLREYYLFIWLTANATSKFIWWAIILLWLAKCYFTAPHHRCRCCLILFNYINKINSKQSWLARTCQLECYILSPHHFVKHPHCALHDPF